MSVLEGSEMSVKDMAQYLLDSIEFNVRTRRRFHINFKGRKDEIISFLRRNDKNVKVANCGPCHLNLLRELSQIAGIELPIGKKDMSLRERRLEMCRGCEHFKPLTQSCGTLLLDGLGRGPGQPCGCYMPLKASFKVFDCPMIPSKWEGV